MNDISYAIIHALPASKGRTIVGRYDNKCILDFVCSNRTAWQSCKDAESKTSVPK